MTTPETGDADQTPTDALVTPPDDTAARPSEEIAAPPAPTASSAGQHAAPRPYPTVPPVTSREVAAEPDTAIPGLSTQTQAPLTPPTAVALGGAPVADPSVGVGPAPSPAPGAPDVPEVPDLPRRPGAKRHLLGALLGLVLTPIGLVLAAMGIGHMIDLPAGDGALTDVLGLVLLALGTLVLGVVALLGRWSAMVPITGGVLWGLGVGCLALWDPQGVHDAVHELTDGRFDQVAIDHILQPAQTGSLLVIGVVLLAAGIASGTARRAGRTFGSRTAEVTVARADAERLESARRESSDRAEAQRAGAARDIR